MNDFNIQNTSISEINIVETLFDICKNELGIGIIPESIAVKYNIQVYETLPDKYSELRQMFIYHKDHTISSAEKWLIEKSKPVFKN